jgi:3'(2'), 5'-bisphosphate nucleotidase
LYNCAALAAQDPLDGTKEFTLGYVHYVTVLVGISLKGKAIAGVVHVPFTGGHYKRKHDPLYEEAGEHDDDQDQSGKDTPPGQTIWGAVGAGVHGLRNVPASSSIPAGRRWITTTRTHMSPRLQALLDSMKPERIIRCGGAGSKGLLVLERKADAYVYPQAGTKRWDSAAIDGLVRAAGGQFTDGFGRDIVYDPRADNYANEAGMLVTMTEENHKLYVLPPPQDKDAQGVSGSVGSGADASSAAAAASAGKANL